MSEHDIQRLLVRYCDLVDAADWDAVGKLFARGALADEHGNVFARGAEQVAAYFREHVILYDGSPRTKHLVLNIVFEEARDAELVVNASYLVLQSSDDSMLRPIITGRYRDAFSRDSRGAWRFAERRYSIDLAGDLSRHLNG